MSGNLDVNCFSTVTAVALLGVSLVDTVNSRGTRCSACVSASSPGADAASSAMAVMAVRRQQLHNTPCLRIPHTTACKWTCVCGYTCVRYQSRQGHTRDKGRTGLWSRQPNSLLTNRSDTITQEWSCPTYLPARHRRSAGHTTAVQTAACSRQTPPSAASGRGPAGQQTVPATAAAAQSAAH